MSEEKKKDKKENRKKPAPNAALLSETQIKAEIKAPSGGYFFFGEEDYLKRHYAEQIRRAALADSQIPEMNEADLDEDSYSPSALLDAIAAFPMMGSHRFVMLRLNALPSKKEGEMDALIETISHLSEYPETVFVLFVPSGAIDGATKGGYATAESARFAPALKLAYVPLLGEPRLIPWLGRHVREHGIGADPAALRELIRLCGREMYRLSSEIEKACVLAKCRGDSALTVDAVRESAALSPEEDAFALSNAVMRGDRKTALECLGRAIKRAEPPIKLLAGISGVIADLCAISQFVKEGETSDGIAKKLKMNEYRARLYVNAVRGVSQERLIRALSLCAETDKRMKTSSNTGYAPLEMLVCAASAAAAKTGGASWRR
ncbi:MAG: DNA polymerase III subunit delta [Clostridia bacterium]|nr:DNA polymerase III subunit delta [Clostridia bacterium]